MRPTTFAIAALAAAGCVSVAREQPPVRMVHGRASAEVVATVLDALAAVGAQGAAVKPGTGGGRAVIRAWMIAGGYERRPFLVEVAVTDTGGEVRVAVAADPVEGARGAVSDALQHAGEDARSRTGCGCAADDPIGGETKARDDLLLLAQGRRVVAAVLAALDARLR